MKTVRLGDHATFLSGFAFKSSLFNENGQGLPIIRIRDVVRGYSDTFYSGRYEAKYVVRQGEYLIGMDGEFNLARWQSDQALLNQRVCKIDGLSKDLDRHYLAKFLPILLKKIEDETPFVTVKHLSVKKLNEAEIPLPPLAEQKRIAAILDAADALRAKRRETLAQLDTLLQSTFLDMFGDPVTNPRGWEVKTLKEGVSSFEGGRNLMPIEKERGDGVRVLKVSAVTSGEYRPDESKPFSEGEVVEESHMVKQGDLLISRANTSALVGAVCYVWQTEGCEMLPDKVWRFVWTLPRRIEPLFMLHLARSCYFREQLIQRATGTSGSMKNIGKTKMLNIPIPLPPLPLQRRFAAIVESAEQQKTRLRAHLTELDILFASLQDRAFKGAL